MTDNAAPAATAVRAVAGALLRHLFTALGTILVAHGYLDDQTATSAVAPIVECLLGAGTVAIVAGWSAFRAQLMHSRWVQAWLAPARSLPSGSASTTS